MKDLSYERLFQIIYPSLPAEWRKLVVRASFQGKASVIKYYVRTGNGKYIDCFNLGCNPNLLFSIIKDIHDEVASVRDKLEDHSRWNAVAVVIDAEGSFKADFDYSETAWTDKMSEETWSEKFLKD